MPLIVVALGWLAAVILGAVAAVTLTAAARKSVSDLEWSWAAATTATAEVFLAFAVLAVVTLSYLAGIVAVVAGVAAGILLLTGHGEFAPPVRTLGDALRREPPAGEPAPRRERRPEVAAPAPERNGSGRRRAAPPPLPPAADDPPAPVRPRFAPSAGNIPPDHAAAHQRIASYEPEGLAAFRDFLTCEARGFAGYGEAFAAHADGLIHGPGVPPAALRALFEFADGFGDVAAMLNLAVKRFHDYFAGHLEWTESHDPTRDGHWTIRE